MKLRKKIGLIHSLLQPKVSFLDPTNTFTVSAYQTACGSADILSHLFDVYYFAENEGKMDMTDRIIEEIIKTVVKFAPVALKEPDNYETRANLIWAATWALNGFLGTGIKQETTCHMIEYELSAFHDITHGHGLAIITPRWIKHILNEKLLRNLKNLA